MNLERTFLEMADDPPGTIYFDQLMPTLSRQDCRLLILKGGASCCAYLAVPLDHPLVRELPDTEAADARVDVHGGFTYAKAGSELTAGVGWFLWGWDYGHLGDQFAFRREVREVLDLRERTLVSLGEEMQPVWDRMGWMRREKAWTPLDVWADAQPAVPVFGRWMLWAERRVMLRRIARSSKSRRASPLLRRIMEARLPEPSPERRYTPGKLRAAARSLEQWSRQREADQRRREIKQLRRIARRR